MLGWVSIYTNQSLRLRHQNFHKLLSQAESHTERTSIQGSILQQIRAEQEDMGGRGLGLRDDEKDGKEGGKDTSFP